MLFVQGDLLILLKALFSNLPFSLVNWATNFDRF
jgi:hypothetical protein